MFVTGTVGYFRHSVDHWMRPELPLVANGEEKGRATDAGAAMAVAQQGLQSNVAGAKRWYIDAPTVAGVGRVMPSKDGSAAIIAGAARPRPNGRRADSTWSSSSIWGPSSACRRVSGNRLVPAELPGRPSWEFNALFLTWIAFLAHSLWRPLISAWREGLLAVAALYVLVPLANMLTSQRHLGVTVLAGAWELFGVDLTALVFASLCLMAWHVLARKVMHPAKDLRPTVPRTT